MQPRVNASGLECFTHSFSACSHILPVFCAGKGVTARSALRNPPYYSHADKTNGYIRRFVIGLSIKLESGRDQEPLAKWTI